MTTSARTGKISVQTGDIFPIIKKWLYSEHDIFIRELIANACDAITKRQTLGRSRNIEIPKGKVDITLDAKNKTIQITDNGIGLTEEEVEKYIAQLAFSGAEEFVTKMKDAGADTQGDIIGKFGLGFYSAFMVSTKVVVESLSMNEGAQATKWSCEGETDYTFEASSKKEVGTTITLYIDPDSEEFLGGFKLKETLQTHCKFMPSEIYLNDLSQKASIEKTKAEAKTDEDKAKLEDYSPELINNPTPIWKRDPAQLKDEDYKKFFSELFPYEQEPLFWIHLKVDHPFTLQGILYFPKFNPQKPVQERNIKLYCKQVFVSDDVKNIIPEYLNLLKGAIDSTDIPLNVSRSSLQGDPNIKKISNYISKKVAEALKKLYKADRQRYETIWEDLQLFVKYGVISDTKFDELMRPFVLFKNSEHKLVTFEEYRESIPKAYKEKLENKVIYFEKDKSDLSLRSQLLSEGIHAIETEEYIDPHFMQYVEATKNEKLGEIKFHSVDSEIENLLADSNTSDEDMKIKDIFSQILAPESDKKDDEGPLSGGTEVDIKKLKNSTHPAYFKIDEQMKRLQQMTKSMGGASGFPLKKTLVVNPSHPLIRNTFKIWEKGDKNLAEQMCHHVQDLASLSSEGLKAEEKEAFVSRSQALVEKLSQYAL